MGGKTGIYGLFAAIGLIVPIGLGACYISKYGFDLQLMVDQVTASVAVILVLADVFLSSVVFWIWSFGEARRNGMTWWYFPIVNVLVGLCFALPLFLYLREKRSAPA